MDLRGRGRGEARRRGRALGHGSARLSDYPSRQLVCADSSGETLRPLGSLAPPKYCSDTPQTFTPL
jgi:hypothetical protein